MSVWPFSGRIYSCEKKKCLKRAIEDGSVRPLIDHWRVKLKGAAWPTTYGCLMINLVCTALFPPDATKTQTLTFWNKSKASLFGSESTQNVNCRTHLDQRFYRCVTRRLCKNCVLLLCHTYKRSNKFTQPKRSKHWVWPDMRLTHSTNVTMLAYQPTLASSTQATCCPFH